MVAYISRDIKGFLRKLRRARDSHPTMKWAAAEEFEALEQRVEYLAQNKSKVKRGRKRIASNLAKALLRGIELAREEDCLDDLYEVISKIAPQQASKGKEPSAVVLPSVSRDKNDPLRWASHLRYTLKLNLASKDRSKTLDVLPRAYRD